MSSAPVFPAIHIGRSAGAYDIRGRVPEDLGVEAVELLGRAFGEVIAAPPSAVVVGRDMRESGIELAEAFRRGARRAGLAVIDIGLCSTDELYFASGALGAYGAMITASHNPARYNGIKLCRPGAVPIASTTGLGDLRDAAIALHQQHVPPGPESGSLISLDILPEYAKKLRSLVDLTRIRPLTVVVDAGSGMAGLTVAGVLGQAAGLPRLPVEIVALNCELDGSFPVHDANPLNPSNTRQLQETVVSAGADLGLAFDGDADRCFVVDERGERVDPSALTVLIGLREAARLREGEPPVVLHNLITSAAVPEILGREGIETRKTRVGHSFIKKEMAERRAVFAGEHSGHFYFRDFFRADSGLLAAMHVLAAVGESDQPLSELLSAYSPYYSSGEINVTVADLPAAMARGVEEITDQWGRESFEIDHLDGVSLIHWEQGPRWWANLRPSHTEPLLRINVEAEDEAVLAQVIAQLRGAVGE